MLNGKEAIIFDLDGTLIDSVNALNEVYATLVKNLTGKVASADQIQNDWDEFVHVNEGRNVLSDGFILFLNNKYNDGREVGIKELKQQYKDLESDYITNKFI